MPTDHTTEDQARRLLANAAATIEVDESAPLTLTGLPEPPHRRWPVLAAAAAVLIAVGGGYLVAEQLGEDEPPPPSASPSTPPPQEHVYADDEMPSLTAYTRDEAVRLLTARGVAVKIEKEYSCEVPRDYVIRTAPVAGAPTDNGDRVTLVVTGGIPPGVRCAVWTEKWQQVFDLTRFARGLGPAPRLANGTVIAADAPAVAALAEIATRPATFLRLEDELPSICRGSSREAGESADFLYGYQPIDGPETCPVPVLEIEWTSADRIASVRLVSSSQETEPDPAPERAAAASVFIAWARGHGPAPTFADRVRQLGPGFHRRWNTDPERREGWVGCSGAGFPMCGLDPVGALVQYRGRVSVSAGFTSCERGLPRPLADRQADAVSIDAVLDGRCAPLIHLWITEDGVIDAVAQSGLAPR